MMLKKEVTRHTARFEPNFSDSRGHDSCRKHNKMCEFLKVEILWSGIGFKHNHFSLNPPLFCVFNISACIWVVFGIHLCWSL